MSWEIMDLQEIQDFPEIPDFRETQDFQKTGDPGNPGFPGYHGFPGVEELGEIQGPGSGVTKTGYRPDGAVRGRSHGPVGGEVPQE